jgi:methanogenic corrinoid protein MtbC1
VLFISSATWSRAAFLAREMGDADIRVNLRCMRAVVAEHLPATIAARASSIIDQAIAEVGVGHGVPVSPLERLGEAGTTARLFLLQLLQREREEAERIVQELLEGNMPLSEIYERVITPAMNEIGHMWHLREASVADEHYCTASTQAIMARLRGQVRSAAPNGMLAIACSSGGDMHELGIRMASDLFELAGWRVECLGANMPSGDVAEAMAPQPHRGPANLLAISAGTVLAVRSVASLIATIRATPACQKAAVLVGGLPFHLAPGLWRKVGADGFAQRATEAPAAAIELVRARSGAPTRA